MKLFVLMIGIPAFPTIVFVPSEKIVKEILVLFHNALNWKVLYCRCILKVNFEVDESAFSSALLQQLWKNTASFRKCNSSNSRGQRKQTNENNKKNPLFNPMAGYNAIEICAYKSENDKSLEIQIITLFYIREVYCGQLNREGVGTCLRS